jgi:hypothetical protein
MSRRVKGTWRDGLGAVAHVERLRGGVVERGGCAHGGGVAQRERGRDARRERHLRLPDRARLHLVQPLAHPAHPRLFTTLFFTFVTTITHFFQKEFYYLLARNQHKGRTRPHGSFCY